MKKIFILFLLLMACTFTGFEKRCYELVGDPDGTQLILEKEGDYGKLTITDPVGGEPVEGLWGFEEGAFVHEDGTRLNYNEERAWYSNNEFLDGIEGTAVSCE